MSLTGRESWRPVNGYEGIYEVSSFGRVRSLERVVVKSNGVERTFPGTVLKLYTDDIGRVQVNLFRGGKGKSHRVHRLVANAFIENPQGLPLVLHGDGNPSNNQVDNLRWGTHSENRVDSVIHGTHPMASKTHCKQGHLLEKPNLVAYGVREGTRRCKACSWERARVQKEGGSFSIQKSNQNFKRIMNSD